MTLTEKEALLRLSFAACFVLYEGRSKRGGGFRKTGYFCFKDR